MGNKSFYLTKDVVTAGKLSTNDIPLNDNSVSRTHCKFVKTKTGCKIQDLGSTNGTYVNGKKVKEKALSEGDTITIGRTMLSVLTVSRGESFSDVDDQKISMVIPLSDEFIVPKEKKLEIESYSIISFCYKQKRDYKEAMKWLEKAQGVEEKDSNQEYALKYEIASLYEDMDDAKRALKIFDEVNKWDPQFRDVAERIKSLQEKT